jgi:hypothetical protein
VLVQEHAGRVVAVQRQRCQTAAKQATTEGGSSHPSDYSQGGAIATNRNGSAAQIKLSGEARVASSQQEALPTAGMAAADKSKQVAKPGLAAPGKSSAVEDPSDGSWPAWAQSKLKN